MKPKLRRQLLDWHLYLGLLCAPYFVLYGASGIAFNHHVQGEAEVTYWERTLDSAAPGADDLARARGTREALGLGGELPRSRVRRTPDGSLEFALNRPGRRYQVAVSPDGTRVRVAETSRGFIGVLREMHGGVAVPSILWTKAWGLYTDVSTVTLLFAVPSGLLLWWPVRRKRAIGAVGIGVGSLVLVTAWTLLW